MPREIESGRGLTTSPHGPSSTSTLKQTGSSRQFCNSEVQSGDSSRKSSYSNEQITSGPERSGLNSTLEDRNSVITNQVTAIVISSPEQLESKVTMPNTVMLPGGSGMSKDSQIPALRSQ